MNEWQVALNAKAVLGEGPTWDAQSSTLWWVDIERGELHRFDPESGSNHTTPIGEKIGSVVPRRGGGFVAGLPDGVGLFDADDRIQHRLPIETEIAEARMNDGKCDPSGRFWTGTMTDERRISALYRVDADHSVHRMLEGVGISNGLDWNPDRDRMYYIDTPTRRVDVFAYDDASGEIGERRALVQFSEQDGVPDGMTVDAEGHLWIAFWDGGCVRRFDPEGHLVHRIELPVTRPTSCAFGGPELRELYVTSASRDFGPAQLAEQPLAGAVFRLHPGVAGRAAHHFAG